MNMSGLSVHGCVLDKMGTCLLYVTKTYTHKHIHTPTCIIPITSYGNTTDNISFNTTGHRVH